MFGPKAKENEEIRGLLNAGHRRGAVAGRCVVSGKTVRTEEIPAYCAVAYAGLGGLPDTILSRCVVIRMRRRAARREGRTVAAPRARRRPGICCGPSWPAGRRRSGDRHCSWPAFPAGVADRDADVWEALLAVADAAGGHWPTTARAAAVALVAQAKQSTPSLGILLLQHLRDVFGDADALWTETILERLHKLDEAPWADLRGKPLDARGLANRLGKYEVRPGDVRIGETSARDTSATSCGMSGSGTCSSAPESATSATSATTEHPHDPACSGCSACSASPGDERQRESETLRVDLSVGRLV